MLNQIRLAITEILLGWCLSIAPKNKEGLRLITHIAAYMQSVAKSNPRESNRA